MTRFYIMVISVKKSKQHRWHQCHAKALTDEVRRAGGKPVAFWRLPWPFLQSPSCGAGLAVWPPYAWVLGPACRRSPTTLRAVGGTGRGWAEGFLGWSLGDVGGGQLLQQHCTMRTRAEQDPAGEWGAFSKERSTGAPFSHTPLTLSSSVSPPRPPPSHPPYS